MKKILAIILVLACVLGLCACGKSGKTGGPDRTADGKVRLTIGLPSNALVLDHDKNALTNWVEKECNVELVFIEYSGGSDVATQISTNIAARQELPDILFGVSLGDKQIKTYGDQKYFVNLEKYFADKEGASKTFWDRINNELTEYDRDVVLSKIVQPETGAIYGVPIVETSLVDKMAWQPWINQKWLDNLGLKAPTNIQELEAVLEAFQKQDANGNGNPNDEIPLYGGQNVLGGKVVDWLMNMFCYYHSARPYNVGEDGKLFALCTTDEYREGLKFINRLYKKNLLPQQIFTTSASEMRTIVTPSTKVAQVGIFLGHLTTCVAMNNEVLYEYVPLENWGNVIRYDLTCKVDTFITEDCADPDKAFEVLMKLWSWDGSMRVRYGEKDVNWTDADEGAKSDIGMDATYKLISDPLQQQSTAKWAKIASTLNVYAEGETAQISENMSEWETKKSQMHAESYALFEKREAAQDSSQRCPTLTYTVEEEERLRKTETNVSDRRSKAQTEFITGVMDINSDADWNGFKNQLKDLGLDILLQAAQVAYDRS